MDQLKQQLEQAQGYDNVKDLFDAAASYLRYLGHSPSRSCRNFTEKQMMKSFGKMVIPTPIKSGLIYCHECSPNHQVKVSSFFINFYFDYNKQKYVIGKSILEQNIKN